MKKLLSAFVAVGLLPLLFLIPVKADTATGTSFRLTKSATPSTVSRSANSSFAITIENIAVTNSTPVTLVDTLPNGWTYNNDAKLTQLNNSVVDFAPAVLGQELTWTFEGSTLISIPSGQNIVVSFTAKAPDTVGTYTNQVCLENPENLCADADVSVQSGIPSAGTRENIGLITGISAALIFASLFLKRDKRSLEEKLVDKV